MRIAVWHNLPSGGGRRALADHVAGLLVRGHEIEIWSNPHVADASPPFPAAAMQHFVALRSRPFERGGLLPRQPILRRRMSAMSEHLDLVAAEMRGGGFDVLLGGACRYFRTVNLASRVDVPSVLYLGEPYRWLYEALPVLPWALEPRRHDEPVASWVRRRCRDAMTTPGLRRQVAAEVAAARSWDRILVNSAYSRESVIRAYGVTPRVCYLGIDVARWTSPARPRERMILGVGAVIEEKGIERAVRAVSRLPEPRPRLVWVGNIAAPGYEQELQRLAQQLGVDLETHVAVSDEALRDLYASAAVMLYAPSLEPFGLVPLEASAAGLPVVGLAEAGVRETVVDGVNGLLVMDEEQLAPALSRILDDSALAASLSDSAVQFVADAWSIDGATDRIESHLMDVVSDSRT